jgi:predicted lipoprotein with Yx(FWY)xxD motif
MIGAATAAVTMLAACSSTSQSGGAGGGTHPTAAPSATAGAAPASVASSALGSILVDNKGKTIYFFAIDSPNHSACTGTCLQYWPIVAAPATIPTSVPGVTAPLGSLTRADGMKQLTIAGLPAYTFSGDSAPGMTSGQDKNLSGGLWWVVSPAGTAIKSSAGSSSSAPRSSSGGGY